MTAEFRTRIGNVEHLSLPQAALMTGLTRQAVWEACRRKRMAAVKHGRFWYVPVAAVRRWRAEVEAKKNREVA